MKPRHRVSQHRWRIASLIPFFLVAIVAHVVLLGVAAVVIPRIQPARPIPRPQVLELVDLRPTAPTDPTADAEEEEEPEEEEVEEEEKKDFDGQIVEIAPPELEEKPKDADYLAEYDQAVEEETRSERFRLNPEVIAREYSEEEKVEFKGEAVPDLQVTQPSTGASVGNDRFDPDRDGLLAALPSQFDQTNKEGNESPVPSSALQSMLAGAPSNDRLDEKRGTQTLLNTKEYQYASYILRIRRLVQFYWNQNLENLPASVRLAKPEYTTRVNAVLDGTGTLEKVAVVGESGSMELDDAVLRAFRVAGPYPNPPEGMIEKDGRVYLPDMGFTVVLGVAQMKYEGIDPRAGVQFPGILKSPR